MPKEIISEEEITLPQVKKILTQRGKEGELSFQQSITLEHATVFSRMAPAVSIKLVEKLISSYDISRSQAVQIVNIAPTTIEELKSVYDTKMTNLTDEKLLEIVDLIVKNRS
ncbi:MAG: RNA polymerase Rpb4 family protein [Candidatus Thorarchaeota archaeon]|nr:RNA polymerase Rpb4 family protein [Candidatus Thorarchaeota archaeon]